MITKEDERVLFDKLLAHTLKVSGVQKLSELSTREKNTYYQYVGVLRIVVDDVKKEQEQCHRTISLLKADLMRGHTPQEFPENEPTF